MVVDERLKAEINTFMFNDVGKPEAISGNHDDMVFAVSLALIGMDQIEQVQEERQAQRPSNVKEMLQFEMSTGSVFSRVSDDFSGEHVAERGPMSSLTSR